MDELTRYALEVLAAYYEAANSGERDKLLEGLSNWSLTRSWAWDALLAILGGASSARRSSAALADGLDAIGGTACTGAAA